MKGSVTSALHHRAVPPAPTFDAAATPVRARLWVSPVALKLHDKAPRLWLVLADGWVLNSCSEILTS